LVIFCDVKKPPRVQQPASVSAILQKVSKADSDENMPEGRRYLLLYSREKGRLLGPSGKIMGGEPPEDAMRRIALSQLGLSLKELENMRRMPADELHLFSLELTYERLKEISMEINNGSSKIFFLAGLLAPDDVEKERFSPLYGLGASCILAAIEARVQPGRKAI
jgi:8-oxo-dGTP pyrophosphatase MutT (NUDIX family)